MGSIDGLTAAGRYQLVEHLGGNAAVCSYKALHQDSAINACIVVVDGDQFADPNAWSYFKQEFEIIRPGQASRIAQPIECGENPDNVFWCAYEFLKGTHLGSLVRDHGLPTPARAVEIAKQTLEAMQRLHSYGVAHRVITPASIFINDLEQVKLLHGAWSRLLLSLRGGAAHPELMSNLPFLAPEVATAGMSDVAADVYSLGANLYFLLCGQPTHWTDDPAELVQMIQAGAIDFDAPREFAPDEAVELLEELLQTDPEDRPLNLEALHERMDDMVGRLYSAQAEGAGAPPFASIEDAFEEQAPGPPPLPPPPGGGEAPRESPVAPGAAGPTPLESIVADATASSPPPAPPPVDTPGEDSSPGKGSPEEARADAPPAGGRGNRKVLLIVAAAIGVPLVLCVVGWAVMAVLGGLLGEEPESIPKQQATVQPTPTPTPAPPDGSELLPFIATVENLLGAAGASEQYFEENGRFAYNLEELLPGHGEEPGADGQPPAGLEPERHARNVRLAYDGWGNPIDVRREFLFSAGPDGEWDTRDDIWIDGRRMEMGWLRPRALDRAAGTPEAGQLNSLLEVVTIVSEEGFTP